MDIWQDCSKPKHESMGHSEQVTSTRSVKNTTRDNPMNYLLSDSDDEHSDVKMICVVDQGSRPQRAKVIVGGGVPFIGIVDSRADITIMGGPAFKQVASVTKLRKRDFKQPDKIPRNYDQQPFHIDGWFDIDIEFQDKAMGTPIYVKMDAPKQFLLFEGVCRQLEIITYHPDSDGDKTDKSTMKSDTRKNGDCIILTVRVRLVQDVQPL